MSAARWGKSAFRSYGRSARRVVEINPASLPPLSIPEVAPVWTRKPVPPIRAVSGERPSNPSPQSTPCRERGSTERLTGCGLGFNGRVHGLRCRVGARGLWAVSAQQTSTSPRWGEGLVDGSREGSSGKLRRWGGAVCGAPEVAGPVGHRGAPGSSSAISA